MITTTTTTTTPRTTTPRTGVTAESTRAVRALAASGLDASTIADRLHMWRSSVQRILGRDNAIGRPRKWVRISVDDARARGIMIGAAVGEQAGQAVGGAEQICAFVAFPANVA